MGLQGELASEHSLPPGGVPQQTEELAGPGPRAAPAPEPQARVPPTPGGACRSPWELVDGGWLDQLGCQFGGMFAEHLLCIRCGDQKGLSSWVSQGKRQAHLSHFTKTI